MVFLYSTYASLEGNDDDGVRDVELDVGCCCVLFLFCADPTK